MRNFKLIYINNMKKNFILGYFFGLFLFFLTSEQNLNLAKMEKIDLKLLKNENSSFKFKC